VEEHGGRVDIVVTRNCNGWRQRVNSEEAVHGMGLIEHGVTTVLAIAGSNPAHTYPTDLPTRSHKEASDS
jgi:hypothetical protein